MLAFLEPDDDTGPAIGQPSGREGSTVKLIFEYVSVMFLIIMYEYVLSGRLLVGF